MRTLITSCFSIFLAGLMTGITPIPLGLSTGVIPDAAIRSSSSLDRYHIGAQGRLNNSNQTKKGGAWCPKTNTAKEYLEVDLGSIATVMQVHVIAINWPFNVFAFRFKTASTLHNKIKVSGNNNEVDF